MSIYGTCKKCGGEEKDYLCGNCIYRKLTEARAEIERLKTERLKTERLKTELANAIAHHDHPAASIGVAVTDESGTGVDRGRNLSGVSRVSGDG